MDELLGGLIYLMKCCVLLGVLLVVTMAYTEEDHVLVLTDEDFPSILDTFPHILIEFYAPWCGHCKKLAPIYTEVAEVLHEQSADVRVAKIDCDQHKKAKSTYEVQGFPTLIYFNKGEPVKYNGQRNKETMVNWLIKRTRDPVTVLLSDQIQSIKNEQKVFIVFYGSLASDSGKVFNALALADDYNSFYVIAEGAHEEGTVEMYRPFGETVVGKVDENFQTWVSKYDRPVVVPFDDRTIGLIFAEGKNGIFLFDSEDSTELKSAFAEAASEWNAKQSNAVIFSLISHDNAHLKELSSYIKNDPSKAPIVYIDGENRNKRVFVKKTSEVHAVNILSFLSNLHDHREYKIDESVVYEEAASQKDEAEAEDEEL